MKYPYDIISIVRKKTFSVEAHFTRALDESPLKMFEEPFSRFIFTVIENGEAATANIPVSCAEKLYMDTQALYLASVSDKTKITASKTSPAYTVRFVAGKNRGKTPVQVLAEDPEHGKDALNSEYTWLKENLSKYPANQKLMDAIKDAASIDIEELKSETAQTVSVPAEILSIGQRPLVRKKRADGMCFVYEASVQMDLSRDYPVTVTVTNYYAPVIKTDKGLFNVQSSKMDKSSLVKNSMALSMEEWLNTVSIMKDAKQAFYFSNFKLALNLADEASKKAREEAEKMKTEKSVVKSSAQPKAKGDMMTDESYDDITDIPMN